MEVLQDFILEVLPYAKDVGFLLFGLMGVIFGWRAIRQRNDEIMEKYYDRRYSLYCDVDDAIQRVLNTRRGHEEEWWPLLVEAKRKSRFLIGRKAQESIGRLHELSIEYSDNLLEGNVEKRVPAAKAARKAIEDEFQSFRGHMERYLVVG